MTIVPCLSVVVLTWQNLALGVLEEKKKKDEHGDDISSDEGSSDEDSSEAEGDQTLDTESRRGETKGNGRKVGGTHLAMPSSAKQAQKKGKPLIQEMS